MLYKTILKKTRSNHKPVMFDSEMILIIILFHTYRFRDLKSFYTMYVCKYMKSEFPKTLSYYRFIERQN